MDYRISIWILILGGLWSLLPVESTTRITSVAISTGTSDYLGQTAARIDNICNVTVNINNLFLQPKALWKLRINFPYTGPIRGTCGNIIKVNERIRCIPIVSLMHGSPTISVNNVISTSRFWSWHYNEVNHTALIAWRDLNVSTLNNSDLSLSFKFRVLHYVEHVGNNYTFEFISSYGFNSSSTNQTKTATLKIVGPRITVSSDSQNKVVNAGSKLNVTFRVELSNSSTENASNIQIYMNPSVSGLKVSAILSGRHHSTPVRFNTSFMAIGKCIHILTALQVSEDAHIGHPLNFYFQITYTPGGQSSPAYHLYKHVPAAKMQDIQNVTTLMTMPNRLSPGSLVPVHVSFHIPRGVLPQLSFALVCESSNLVPVPGALFYSNIILAPTLVVSNKRDLNYRPWRPSEDEYLRRFRRSTARRNTLHRPSVTIKHPLHSTTPFAQVKLQNGVGVINQPHLVPYAGSMKMTMALSYGSLVRVLRSVTVTVAPSFLQVVKRYQYTSKDANGYPVFKVSINIKNLANSSGIARGYFEDDVRGLLPSAVTYNTTIANDVFILSNSIKIYFSIPVGDTFIVTYSLSFHKNVAIFLDGRNERYVNVRYSHNITNSSAGPYYHLVTGVACIYRENKINYIMVALTGYIALLLFIGIVVGFVILLVIGILYIKVLHRGVNPFEYDDVQADERQAMLETQNRLLMDESAGGDFNTIKDLSTVKNTDSIVNTLVNQNRHQMYRDLDSLDILSSIYVDQALESEYEKVSVASLTLLLRNLGNHGTLKQEVVNKAIEKLQRDVQRLDKEAQTMHQKEANKVMKKLSRKNKRELQQLLSKQRIERDNLTTDLEGEDDNTRKTILDIQTRQHKAEKDDLVHKLKLQQDEESEKLRKKYSLHKRSMLRDMETSLIQEISEKNPLDNHQAEWLLNEHRRVQNHLDQRYDSELARQRMLLEERLERRRALAKKKELEEENQTELLNTLASQQVSIVRRLRRQEDITPEQADEYLAKIKEDMSKSKEALDKQKNLQQKILQEKVNERKKRQLEVKATNHVVEETQLMRELKEASVTTIVDPTVYIDAVMNLHVKQRDELAQTESELDETDTKDLIDQYQYVVAQTEADIRLSKDQLLLQLQEDGVPNDELNKIIDHHNRELRQLQESHEEERLVQEQNFKAKLLARRKEMKENLQLEKVEQESLRRHENEMVQNLLFNQVSISDEERNRILKEHESNMVQVENSLTLSKLRQKRMLEEALAERKAKQMEKLQQKQTAEATKKVQLAVDSEDEDERSHKDIIDMLKRHGEQRLELITGEDIDIDDELDNVRGKMMEERANALKEQEERIAAMLSSLQIEKAKELSRIEEQQKAINNLKMNLMDDLNDRGVLSDNKCQQIINRHQEEQDRLVKRLDTQRDEQEQVLRERLKKRMEQREKQLTSEQNKQLKEKIEALPARQRAQAQIRKALLLHKQMLEVEQFKTRVTKECNQTLEDAKRQFDIKKEQFLQDQELNFIAGLVQLGKFRKSELLEVLKILFPLKSSQEIEAILAKIHTGKDEPPKDKSIDKEDNDPLAQSSLVDRTNVSFSGIGAIARFKMRSPKRRSVRGNVMTLTGGNDPGGLTPIDRPDPLGRDSPSVIPDTSLGRGSDLPPIEHKKKKKKKKKKRQTQLSDEEGDMDGPHTFVNVRA